MADETQAQAATTEKTTTEATQAVAENTQAQTAATEQVARPEMTLDAALKELKEARAEAAKYRTTAKATEKAKAEAEEKALKEQGEYKKLYEKAQADLKAAADELTKVQRAELQRKVAEKVGLTANLAKRIAGETEAEMEADAREMLAGLPKTIVGNDANKGVSGAPTNLNGHTKEQLGAFLNINSKYLPDR